MSTVFRTTLTVPAELAEQVNNYWHEHRLPTFNAAIRELLEAALAAQKPPTKIRKAS